MVYNIANPRYPNLRFEWHEESKKVYLVRLDRQPLVGDLIAADVDNHGAAINAALIWCRGYKAARDEQELVVSNGGKT